MKAILSALLLVITALAGVTSCTLTAEQQAKLALAEKQAAGVGDKILRIGVFTGQITQEEADAARALGTIIVTPAPTAPVPPAVEVTSGK